MVTLLVLSELFGQYQFMLRKCFMRKINKYLIMLLLVCSIFNGKKSVAWWNLIYTSESFCEYTDEEDDRKIKFFIWEWLCSFKR